MATDLKRVTFVITAEMEPIMDKAKKLFYDHTQSEMIRVLITAGLSALAGDASTKSGRREKGTQDPHAVTT